MRSGQFGEDAAADIIRLWNLHLGVGDRAYGENPALLVSEFADPHLWPDNPGPKRQYMPKLGSRYSEETRLSFDVVNGKLELTCRYPDNPFHLHREQIREALLAQADFNAAIREYLSTR